MREENPTSSEDLYYKVYLEERKLLIDAEKESTRSLDKAILTLSAGALGLSLTFIRQIVPIIKEGTFFLLILAWGLFCVSILSTLFSFLTSQQAFARQREILDTTYPEWKKCKPIPSDQKNRPAKCTNVLNIAGIVSFMFGVVCLAIFTIVNL